MSAQRFAIINFYTAGYNRFFRPFYTSVREHFFPGRDKTFFIFTDNPFIQEDDIVSIRISPRGFVHHACFLYMTSIADQLAEFDHIVFFNGNTLIVQNIGPEFHREDTVFLSLLFGSTSGLAHVARECVERNPESNAYIDVDKEDISTYWRSGLWGGVPKEVLPMLEEVGSWTQHSSQSHMEQFINRYFVSHKNEASCLDARYTWSGGWGYNPFFDIRIVFIDKLFRYQELSLPLTEKQMQLFARELNVDGPLYIGPGSWPIDFLQTTATPPENFLQGVRRAGFPYRKVIADVMPPILYKVLSRLVPHSNELLR